MLLPKSSAQKHTPNTDIANQLLITSCIEWEQLPLYDGASEPDIRLDAAKYYSFCWTKLSPNPPIYFFSG